MLAGFLENWLNGGLLSFRRRNSGDCGGFRSLCSLRSLLIMRFLYDMVTIKKQRHFLIVTSEKLGFARYMPHFGSLDQKIPDFFDPNYIPPRFIPRFIPPPFGPDCILPSVT